jgi:hypothetical protein
MHPASPYSSEPKIKAKIDKNMEQPQRTQRSQKAVTRIDSAFVIFAISEG